MTVAHVDAFAPAVAMLQALRDRQISAVELLEMHLTRLQRFNPALNAVVTLVDDARQWAQAADAARARGEDAPLLGLPMTVKESLEITGTRATLGATSQADYVATEDAPIVRRLRAAGAVIFGKTNVPYMLGDWQTYNDVFGRTVNPWNPERTPGGSTGGGAAAVAAGLTPLEIGTDIGGSIRVPSSYCGIFGHKPSERTIPRAGTFGALGGMLPTEGAVLEMPGPMARSAADLALTFSVLAGPDRGDDVAWRLELPPPRRQALQDFRIAIMPPLDWLPVDTDVQGALERTAERLRSAGAAVDTALPEDMGDMRDYYTLYMEMLGSVMGVDMPARERERDARNLGKSRDPFVSAYGRGMGGSAADFIQWHYGRARYRAMWRRFFADWDILLAPIDVVTAFPFQETSWSRRQLIVNGRSLSYQMHSAFPAIATLCGLPATAVPVGLSTDGMPVGLQAIGPYLEDYTPLRFAELVAAEWGGFVPPEGYE